jgi:hypothetical protein
VRSPRELSGPTTAENSSSTTWACPIPCPETGGTRARFSSIRPDRPRSCEELQVERRSPSMSVFDAPPNGIVGATNPSGGTMIVGTVMPSLRLTSLRVPRRPVARQRRISLTNLPPEDGAHRSFFIAAETGEAAADAFTGTRLMGRTALRTRGSGSWRCSPTGRRSTGWLSMCRKGMELEGEARVCQAS